MSSQIDQAIEASNRPKENVAQVAGKVLSRLGVTHVFGVVGSGNYVATSALVSAGARFVAARHESAALMMAAAYARISGHVSVCSVHQGPGLTNSLTALIDATKTHTPLVVITGQTSAGATRSNFYVNQSALIEATGAASEQLYRAETVYEDTMRAFRRAVVERRPVVLNMPLDIQTYDAPDHVGPKFAPIVVDRTRPMQESVIRLADRLAAAKRPLFIAGRGAVLSGAFESLYELGDRIGCLFATSAVAHGFFNSSEWNLGIAGGFSSEEVADLIHQADLVVGFGCSFTTWTTRQDTIFGTDAVVVQVDIERAAIAESARVDDSVVGDADATARDLCAQMPPETVRGRWRTDETASFISSRHTPPSPVHDAHFSPMHPHDFSVELDRLMPLERTVIIDGGHFLGWPVTTWSVPDADGFMFTGAGFQSIGLGIGAAVGAHFARPDRLSVLAVGDGGFLMSVSELETLVRLKLAVLVIVYDDAEYGAEVHHFGLSDTGIDLVKFPDFDIAALARGAGASGITVRNVNDLKQIEAWLEKRTGPLIVDAKIDPTIVGYWAAQDFRGH